MDRTYKMTLVKTSLNALSSMLHVVGGAITGSWWLLTVGIYYYVLGVLRFMIVRIKKHENMLLRFTGWMLIIMSLTLVGTVILAVVRDRGHKFHMILMIAIATYSFTKITLATVNLIKTRHVKSQRMLSMRSASFADATVSIFALQRSMLVSFEGMGAVEIVIMNASLGAAVCATVFLLGINLLKREKSVFNTNENQESDGE